MHIMMQRGGRVKGVSDPGFPEIFPGILAIPSDPGNNFVERGVSDPVSRIFLPGENFVPEIPGYFFREKPIPGIPGIPGTALPPPLFNT